MRRILNQAQRTICRGWPDRRARAVGVLSITVVLVALLTLSTRFTSLANKALAYYPALSPINEHLNPFRNRQALYGCGFPIYDLRISAAEYRGILSIIEQAKQRGVLTDDLKQWSKAKFMCGDVVREVKVRVRGDLANHWAGPRKSWRIKFTDDETFQGLRELNLIIMEDSKAVESRFHNEVFRQLGMITFRDGYAALRINGALQGLYYQVEHADGPLLAYHERPESSILANQHKGTNAAAWQEQITENDQHVRQALEELLRYENEPTCDNLKATLAVTDIDDYLKFIAGTTLFSSSHTRLLSPNHKIYYDTSRGLFCRIPWDLYTERIPTLHSFEIEDSTAAFDVFWSGPMSKTRLAMITDPYLRLKRDRILWSLVRDDSLLTRFDGIYEKVKEALRADVMSSPNEVTRVVDFREIVAQNISVIHRSLRSNNCQLTVRHGPAGMSTLVFTVNNASGVSLRELLIHQAPGNTHCQLYRDTNRNNELDPNDIRVAETVSDNSGEGRLRLEEPEGLLLPDSVIANNQAIYPLPGDNGTQITRPARTVVYPKSQTYNYFLVMQEAQESPHPPPKLELIAANAVTADSIEDQDLTTAEYSPDIDFNPARRTLSRREFLEQHRQFLAHPHNDRTVILMKGDHYFQGTTVIPEGISLSVAPGAVLLMQTASSIVCFGPVIAEGTSDQPIEVRAASDTPWGTFAIARPGGESRLRFLNLSGAQGAWVDGILFSGALAIHDGDATISNCRFSNCTAEDAVNIKNGHLLLETTAFSDNASDSIDLDFVNASITNCDFSKCGGDAIDTSGSTTVISSNRITSSADKGISVGEKSQASISDNLLMNNTIAIAVKDLSTADISHCTFVNNVTTMAAYRKKPCFGGGTARVEDSILLSNKQLVAADSLSRVDMRNSITSDAAAGDGCVVAPENLIDRLRSNDYVYLLDSPSNTPMLNSSQQLPGIINRPQCIR